MSLCGGCESQRSLKRSLQLWDQLIYHNVPWLCNWSSERAWRRDLPLHLTGSSSVFFWGWWCCVCLDVCRPLWMWIILTKTTVCFRRFVCWIINVCLMNYSWGVSRGWTGGGMAAGVVPGQINWTLVIFVNRSQWSHCSIVIFRDTAGRAVSVISC